MNVNSVISKTLKHEHVVSSFEGKHEQKPIIEYSVGMANVVIVDINGRGYYIVEEPKLSNEAIKAYNFIIEYLYKYLKPSQTSQDPASLIETYMWKAAKDAKFEDILEREYAALRYYVLRDTIGYGKLDVLMRDVNIEEIAVEGPSIPVAVVHREASEYRWLNTNIVFYSENELRSYVQRLALKGGKSISTANPIVEVKLPEGHRVALTYSREVSGRGSSLVIRKFPEKPLTITHLTSSNTLSLLMAAYLWRLIEAQQLIFIIGPMASGKTTVLQALTSLIPPDCRVITVEDTPELNLHHEHWDPLYTRRSIGKYGDYDITLEDLVKFAWRRRAEYLIVGEVRGEEVKALVQAAASGHGGLTTFHSDNVESMILRLQSPPLEVKESFLSTISSVVVMRRVRRAGKTVRRVVEISEIIPSKSIGITFRKIFKWNPTIDKHEPSSIEELINISVKLKDICEREGITVSEMIEDLRLKLDFLKSLVEREIYEYVEIAKEISKYYYGKGLNHEGIYR